MIKSNDNIRYCQDVFGYSPVSDIVKRRTVKFLKKYKEANNNEKALGETQTLRACRSNAEPKFFAPS